MTPVFFLVVGTIFGIKIGYRYAKRKFNKGVK